MQSTGSLSQASLKERITTFGNQRWERLTDPQKAYAKKAWGILTFKWRWQIAMNIPYLAIFILDRTIPAVHKFNMDLLSSLMAKLPIPEFLTSMIAAG
ncbi:hypothetical protein PMIT1342_00560 [Prochlorococcus marinus str. MIT 1342]|uniref:hypothetical protein n=1 Tax=Prochlorococcus TaxID=1218 RepID=UPI0007B33910|nr:hypothetical protein [Prochlorococcus marinus]KZR82909.1 hypothetical protein PMIT1342_00560 [Prochlorococcus marinus str. MIT 1342]